jgi:hypothetical protein
VPRWVQQYKLYLTIEQMNDPPSTIPAIRSGYMVFQKYETPVFTPSIPCISDESTDIVLTNTILSADISYFMDIFELVFIRDYDISSDVINLVDPPSGGFYGIDICSTKLFDLILDSYDLSNGYTANYPDIETYPSSQVAKNPLLFDRNRNDFIYDFGSVLRDISSNIINARSRILDEVLIDNVNKITRSFEGRDQAKLNFANNSIDSLSPIGMQLRIVKNRTIHLLNSTIPEVPDDPQEFIDTFIPLVLNNDQKRKLLINLHESEMIDLYTPYSTSGLEFGNEYYTIGKRGSVSFSMSLVGGTTVRIPLLPQPTEPTTRTMIVDGYSLTDISNGIAYPQISGYNPDLSNQTQNDIRNSTITFPVGVYYSDTLGISGNVEFPIRISQDESNFKIFTATYTSDASGAIQSVPLPTAFNNPDSWQEMWITISDDIPNKFNIPLDGNYNQAIDVDIYIYVEPGTSPSIYDFGFGLRLYDDTGTPTTLVPTVSPILENDGTMIKTTTSLPLGHSYVEARLIWAVRVAGLNLVSWGWNTNAQNTMGRRGSQPLIWRVISWK